MKIVYAATHVEKYHTTQGYRSEPDHDTRDCLLSLEIDLIADSLEALIGKLGAAYQIEMQGARFERLDHATCVAVRRLEDADGEEPSVAHRVEWQHGRLEIFHAEYRFLIERRTVQAISAQEWQALGR